MLKSLQVKNYVLIDSLDISFPAGLSIITGQTGAGKSILLGALSLALGSKADATMVGSSGDGCAVEAVFETGDPSVREIIDGEGLDWNGGNLIVRRVVNRSGRSRAFVNDEPVQLAVLGRIAGRLVDIHSQHQNLLLADRKYQLFLLDHYSGNGDLLAAYKEVYSRLSAEEREYDGVCARLAELDRQKDYNSSMLGQLQAANLKEGELEELEKEQKALANAEEIRDSLYGAENLLAPADGEEDLRSLDSAMKEAVRLLEKTGRVVAEAGELGARLESARLEIDDILETLRQLESRTVVSPERLDEVESRMSLLYGLMRKFSCSDIPGLIAERDRLAGLVTGSEELEEKKGELEKKMASDRAELKTLAGKLHGARASHAVPFAARVQEMIRSLEMDQAVFSVSLEEGNLTPDGADSVTFLFSSTGKNPVDVAKCASGGEISRIMLCLKALMAEFAAMPTLVFDEIDTGVSGSVADKMGSMICRMGASMQVFAITHLPQVAAKGDAHYLVSKEISDGTASTEIHEITGEDRVREIARMLSGSAITPEAVANARALMRGTEYLF